MTKPILLVRTGGTVESAAYGDVRNPPPIVPTLTGSNTPVVRLFSELPYQQLLDMHVWDEVGAEQFIKDSNKYKKPDIVALANFIKRDPHSYFILTHGTDAMARNAEMLEHELKGSGKRVVFVSAMVPLSMEQAHASDGVESTKYALSRLAHQLDHRTNGEGAVPPGVYITGRVNGRLGLFDPATVKKDREKSKETLEFTVTARSDASKGMRRF